MDFIKLADISDPMGQVEAALDISKGHEIWESLNVQDGYSIILGNGTVLPKSSENAGMGALANVVDSGFDYANTPVRGVNIGNWLVMECWMDPGFCNNLNQHAGESCVGWTKPKPKRSPNLSPTPSQRTKPQCHRR